MLKIYDLAVNYQKNPVLVKSENPVFSWKLDSDKCGVMQKSYKVEISANDALFFDSGIVESDKCFDVSFENLALPMGEKVTLTVTVCDNKGESDSASVSFFTELSNDEWNKCQWIKPKRHISGWAPYLRTKFNLSGVKSAKMYACGLGIAEYYINGQRTDDYYIDTPATNYDIELLYRCFDVTNLLTDGGNCLSVLLGEGFYSQSRVWGHFGFKYGDVCAKIYLEIETQSGEKKIITTNTEDWKYKYSPISMNNIYGGETYDCRLETPNFGLYESDDDEWCDVVEDTSPKSKLVPCEMPPVREIRRIPAKSVRGGSGLCDGAYVFDLGENFAGICEYHLPWSPRGAIYVFRYTEVLNSAGSPDHRSTGGFATQCIQQDMYICSGDPKGEVYRPRFTYHGFRYVEITGIHDFSEGYGTMPKPCMVTGIALSTDMSAAATFDSSHTYLTRLMGVMDNTYRSNYHGFPEDCPAREKCGWLGDAQIVVNYGLLNYDSVSSYRKYLDDIRATVESVGVWQMTSPGKRGCGEATPLWGCAQVLIPYYMYKYCGDSYAIKKNFDLMEAWVKHELDRSKDYLIDVGLGDWCPPTGNGEKRIPVIQSSTFMFYEICKVMEEVCTIFAIGDASYYGDLAEKIKASIIEHFYDKENHTYNYHASNGVALTLGIYPDGDFEKLLSSCVEKIKADGYEMQTGIYGAKYLAPALMENGYGDVALDYFFNKEKTSFATMMDDNGTSIWEKLEMKHVMPYDEPSVSSYNHPMLGGFLYTSYTHIAGIVPVAAGFKRFEFSPCKMDKIEHFDVTLDTVVGKIAVSKSTSNGVITYKLSVPANSVCYVGLDGACVKNADGECLMETVLYSGEYIIEVK